MGLVDSAIEKKIIASLDLNTIIAELKPQIEDQIKRDILKHFRDNFSFDFDTYEIQEELNDLMGKAIVSSLREKFGG